MGLNPGARLGGYEILAPLGSGGMGDVYRALDAKLGREVAVKVLPEKVARDRERVSRFEREARLLALLNHPGIATLYGFETTDDLHYLVMELVEGETLAERIARRPVPPEDAIVLFRQIAEAIEAAHEKGVVHRDLKPANIKITPEGVVKLLDFGLAKAYSGDGAPGDMSQSPTMTRDATGTGVILGTAAYMSPEQARGKAVDHRTDVWAFGCCLYEALAGRVAFLADTVSDTIVRILEKEPDWNALPGGSPRVLIEKCLRKDPHHRLQAIGDARIELEEGPIVTSQDQSGLRRMVAIAIAISIAILAVAVATGSLMRGSDRSPPILHATITMPDGAGLHRGRAASAVISPDGSRIVYAAAHDGTTQLYLRRLAELDTTPIEGTTGAEAPFFSPDGQWVGFLMGGDLVKVPIAGGAVQRVLDSVGTVRGASWGDDDRIVFSMRNNVGLARVSAEGRRLEVLTTPAPDRREKSHRLPEVLPGSNAVLFTLGTGDIETFDDASIAVLSLATGDYRILLNGATNPRYSETGHILFAHNDSLFAVPFDPSRLRLEGTPVPVLDGLASYHAYGAAEFSVARNGTLIYAPGGSWGEEYRVARVDRQGTLRPLIDGPGAFVAPRLSPDGRYLALWTDDANASIWVYDVTRESLSRFAAGFDNVSPSWTPDGSAISFRSSRAGPYDFFLRPVDGSGPAEPLVASDQQQGFGEAGDWSPDGKTFVFSESHPDTGRDLWCITLDAERTRKVILQTGANESYPRFSPDGRFIAFQSDETGRVEVYLTPFPDASRRWQVSTDGGRGVVWNPDGRELFYYTGDAMMSVTISTAGDLTLGKPTRLFERRLFGFDVSPDGQSFVTVVPDETATPPPTGLNFISNWASELSAMVPHLDP